jgi:hypothetical protein
MPTTPRDDGGVTIPGWFVKFFAACAGIALAIATAAVPWAWRVDQTLTRIETQIEGQKLMDSHRWSEIERRLSRLEN